jgi:hypothetical protein
VEGATDEVVLRRIFQESGAGLARIFGLKGKEYLTQKLPGYNTAARMRHGSCW